MSCCKPEIGIIGNKECKLDQTAKVYQTGCAVEFGNFVREHAVSLGASGIILAFIQVSHFYFDFDNILIDKIRRFEQDICLCLITSRERIILDNIIYNLLFSVHWNFLCMFHRQANTG